jgi:hypothetical protein
MSQDGRQEEEEKREEEEKPLIKREKRGKGEERKSSKVCQNRCQSRSRRRSYLKAQP